MEANEAKKPRPRFSSVWSESKRIIWSRRRRLSLGLVLMLIGRLAGLTLPASSKFVIDEVIHKGRRDLLPWLAAGVGLATVLNAGASFLLSQLLGVSAQRSINDMRIRVQEHIARLPIRFFDSTKTGALISRIMNDAEGIRNLVGTGLVQLIGGLVTAMLALFVLFYLNWKLTLGMLVVLLIFGTLLSIAFSRLRPIFRERGKIMAEVTGRLGEALGGIRIVKAYTAEKREELVFTQGAHRIFRNIALSITAISTFSAVTTLLFGFVGVLIMVMGARAILDGAMTLGDFVMYVAMVGMVAAPMVQITGIGTQLSEAFAGLDRIREVMALATEDDEEGREPAGEIQGEVVFDHVGFEYEKGVPVLKDVSFRAPEGTTTALVGPSGSGKSTLISLVMAFNRPTSGRIRIDGRDLATMRLRDYRSNLGVVPQDNFLFDGTIAENIAYSRPRVRRDEILRVSRIAHCDEFVEAFDKKYETIVGERGVKVSGGQRQRIGIARAILADPKILILDEATSSLDSESEAMIQDGLATLRRGRTTFVIAHRLSTIQSADQILVLEGGEIIERGTHEQLLGRGGRYKQLYDKQYRIERNRFINPGEDFSPPTAEVAVAAPAAPGRPSAL